ncbi:MAG: hypothetical protein QW507_01510 [Candidatus Nanoarchaeia archaeon]|nr:hypothetical protein [Candidatus Haiyanarchaeum thermophilum]MCW1303161.1 hypothetical protein [Candidatus Haiyanarchaeum thermophilum]MCW1303826.1 hypothetical protein [Candidatus Haiyanarchaeum thermophilum]MCW1306557.1 hypothetical protein [Candidatus Haiyanarchaeum thermophilum]MCW1306971.1 hypothetical protein [Candidatus Haiyanarchaeum thermophilum]
MEVRPLSLTEVLLLAILIVFFFGGLFIYPYAFTTSIELPGSAVGFEAISSIMLWVATMFLIYVALQLERIKNQLMEKKRR